MHRLQIDPGAAGVRFRADLVEYRVISERIRINAGRGHWQVPANGSHGLTRGAVVQQQPWTAVGELSGNFRRAQAAVERNCDGTETRQRVHDLGKLGAVCQQQSDAVPVAYAKAAQPPGRHRGTRRQIGIGDRPAVVDQRRMLGVRLRSLLQPVGDDVIP